MNKSKIISMLFVVFFASTLLHFAAHFTKNRYQVSRYGKNKAIVLDTTTGEAWATDTYQGTGIEVGESDQTPYLRPIGYLSKQKEDFKYAPNEVRNSKNTRVLP